MREAAAKAAQADARLRMGVTVVAGGHHHKIVGMYSQVTEPGHFKQPGQSAGGDLRWP